MIAPVWPGVDADRSDRGQGGISGKGAADFLGSFLPWQIREPLEYIAFAMASDTIQVADGPRELGAFLLARRSELDPEIAALRRPGTAGCAACAARRSRSWR